MPRVRATAQMITFLDWEGDVPDDVPEDQRWHWIRHNVDGGQFNDSGVGDWIMDPEVEVIDDA